MSPFDLLSWVRGQKPFMTWNQSGNGWKRIVAWDPVAEFIGTSETDPAAIDTFISHHKDNLIAGWVSFDFGAAQLGIRHPYDTKTSPSSVMLRVYPYYVEWENQEDCLIHTGNQWPEIPDVRIISDSVKKATDYSAIELRPEISESHYKKQIDNISKYIRAGDVYQLNYTFPLAGNAPDDPVAWFRYLMQTYPTEHAALILDSDFSLLSLSPERFLKMKNRRFITEPIKGTRPRGKSPEEDDRLRQVLVASDKEAAELNMITDLLRNDLGKICQTGTVRVNCQREVFALANVWHTKAVISGELKPEISPMQGLMSMLPGGSISGCPKRRAVEIIAELEAKPRGVYTGTIGMLFPDGTMDWNIAIRTAVIEQDRITAGVGGGITVQSDPTAEWQEALAKGRVLGRIISS